jgi:hypothetical protein
VINTVKKAYERQERVNAIKAMKKNQRTTEQIAELAQWKYEEKRNTLVVVAGVLGYHAMKAFAKK